MLSKRFWRRQRESGRAKPSADEGLAAFQAEDASENAPQREVTSNAAAANTRPLWRLLSVVTLIAVLEAIPAALWLRQAVVLPGAGAAAEIPPPVAAAVIGRVEPCVASLDTVPARSAAAVDAPRRSTPKAEGTTGVATPLSRKSVGGLISVAAPVAMRIYSGGRIIGTTEAETIMLPVGNHELWFVSDEMGYKVRRSVTVQAGKTTTLQLEPPTGIVHVNASPWAEVWVDNQRVGETPLGNLRVPIGVREFVFRHPELGEKRKSAIITLKEPAKVSIDMRAK